MNLKRTLCSAAVVLAGSTVVATGAAQAATPVTINEAGSTLVYPLVVDWANNFGVDTGDVVNSGAVGSGAGIEDVCGGDVQIGASDAPLGYPGVKECGDGSVATMSHYVEVPWALSATGLLYHIPGVKTGLRLSAADLAKIYNGKITNWDQLQSQEYVTKIVTKTVWKKVHGKRHKVKVHKHKRVRLFKMPNLRITPVFRSDGSGDSYAFTNFMTRADRSGWSYGPTTSFPTGISSNGVGADGNSGVAQQVIATKGAIGYVSVYYLIATLNDNRGLGVAAVRNAAGNYEEPNGSNIGDAAKSITDPPAQNSSSTSASHTFGMVIQYPSKKFKTAYPVSTYTYAIVPRDSGSDAAAVRDFLTYAVSTKYDGEAGGVNVGTPIGFVPLTSAVQSYDKRVIAEIK